MLCQFKPSATTLEYVCSVCGIRVEQIVDRECSGPIEGDVPARSSDFESCCLPPVIPPPPVI